ncbi:hypothetical protein DCO47_16575 [Pseudomonas sp. NDM]|nr:hypothetical protein DCO47_16575 [Pseudomonas sp. NDM]
MRWVTVTIASLPCHPESHTPCRSEPARDSGGSVAYVLNDTPLSRAGSLLQWTALATMPTLCAAAARP